MSLLMRIFLGVGWESMAWSLRRLWCPVPADALVLEVGSGGNPYFRANVLLDAYEDTRERHWQSLVSDRPTILGFVEKLPFKDNSFDFVIASHVLEHSLDPVAFINELQRVAKAGYIEVPDAMMERINPYKDHRLEITVREGKLLIRKKRDWKVDPELIELYEDRLKPILTSDTMRRHPFHFHVRFYWQGDIPFKIINHETELNWVSPGSPQHKFFQPGVKARIKSYLLNLIRIFFSQSKRNRALDIGALLQ